MRSIFAGSTTLRPAASVTSRRACPMASPGSAPASAPAIRKLRRSVTRNHHVRGLDHGVCHVSRLELELVDGLVGNRGCDDRARRDLNLDVRRRLPFHDLHDLAFDYVASAQLDRGLL